MKKDNNCVARTGKNFPATPSPSMDAPKKDQFPLYFLHNLLHLAARCDIRKVAANDFQRIPLMINLNARPHAHAPQDRQRRTPSLNCMLQEETQHQPGQGQALPMNQCPQYQPTQGQARSVRLKHPLNIPFLIQLTQTPVYLFRMILVILNPTHGGQANLLIDFR